MKIYVINGPNLNLLGRREANHYGHDTYQELVNKIMNYSNDPRIKITCLQSNYEGELVEMIQSAVLNEVDAIIINPAAYSHYSIAIMDALLMFNKIKVEVHLSDVKNREEFRQVLITKKACDYFISAKGTNGYLQALDIVINRG